jgi:hypothetical protein
MAIKVTTSDRLLLLLLLPLLLLLLLLLLLSCPPGYQAKELKVAKSPAAAVTGMRDACWDSNTCLPVCLVATHGCTACQRWRAISRALETYRP